MSFFGDLGQVLRGARFRRLFATRLASQFADGIYQAGLAGYVFFNPERHTTPGEVATAFAVLLLPFTAIGPFAGVLIDRWTRRQILVVSAGTKAALALTTAVLVAAGSQGALFLGSALCLLSVNRFLLAALSAALPHVVPRRKLMMANAVTPTCGTFASLVGGGVGAGLRLLAGDARPGAAAILLGASVAFALSALVPLTLRRRELGPDLGTEYSPQYSIETAHAWGAVRDVVAGLVGGVRHIWRRRPARHGLATIAGHRLVFGASTLMALLLYNNTFTSGGVAGLAGFTVALAASGAGFLLGAVATPWAAARIGTDAWIAALLCVGCVALLACGLPFSASVFPVAALALGLVSQGMKVSVDTLVQRHVDDAYRGRAFAVYDMLFNAAFVAATAVAAIAVPRTGVSAGTVLAMAAGYALMAIGWLARARRSGGRRCGGWVRGGEEGG